MEGRHGGWRVTSHSGAARNHIGGLGALIVLALWALRPGISWWGTVAMHCAGEGDGAPVTCLLRHCQQAICMCSNRGANSPLDNDQAKTGVTLHCWPETTWVGAEMSGRLANRMT